jgi:riboflavin kinase/FMN adenylyltransferase
MLLLSEMNLPLSELGGTVVTIGNFDGVHLGHQELIRGVVNDARARELKSVVITFDPHPVIFFHPGKVDLPISSNTGKQKLIARLGVDALLTLQFNERLANLAPETYVREILVEKIAARVVWLGHDFTFGRRRQGNIGAMRALGQQFHFQVNVLEPQKIKDTIISSTKIRELLNAGRVDAAATLLGRPHSVHGLVVSGDQKASAWGFPTINLLVQGGLIPASGIYSGISVVDGRKYGAAIYIGHRPTLDKSDFRVEAHLLDFSGDLYGRDLPLFFLKYLRPDRKFENFESLKYQVEQDCQQARLDFAAHPLKKKEVIPVW